MKRTAFLSIILLSLCATLCAQNNARPLVNQPLIPASAAPGASGFTVTVSGTGFATGAVLKWNGSARATTVLSSSSLQATINSTDVPHVGTANITVVNPAPGGGASNLVYFPIRRSATSVAFAPEPDVNLAGGPIAVGDFNHDGKLDIAVGQTSSDGATGSILLYSGLGNGTFASPVTTASSLPVQTLLTGDFNGDGKLDLLIGTKDGAFGPAEGIAFLGNNAGHFQEKTAFGGGDFGSPIGVADVNGDGILDVIFEGQVQGSGTVLVYLGVGDGTFTQKSLQGLNGTGTYAGIGDFNGDGELDLAVPESGQVDIFLGNGDGTFKPYVPYPCYPCGGSVAVADLNGDGKLDLMVGNLVVLLGNGDGTFTLGASYAPNGGGVIAVGDFNGDGKLDVVTAGDTVWVYLGNGDGTFQNFINTGGFSAIAAVAPFGDFNHDGQLDLVTWGSTADQVGLQTTLSVTPGSLNFGSHKIGSTSQGQAITLTNVSSHSLPISIALTGANPGDFLERNTCGAGLAAGATCQITVAFKPTIKGTRTASVTITYSGVASPQTVTLTGYGF